MATVSESDFPAEDTLVRLLCRALRHHPEEFGIRLDAQGWAEWSLLWGLARSNRPVWARLEATDVAALLAQRHPGRFELAGDRIRARYGHSLPGLCVASSAAPPMLLYHGTGAVCAPLILKQGLRPMGRAHVHLTESVEYAWSVARAALGRPVLLEIAASAAHQAGVQFFTSGEHVWLAKAIGPEFLRNQMDT